MSNRPELPGKSMPESVDNPGSPLFDAFNMFAKPSTALPLTKVINESVGQLSDVLSSNYTYQGFAVIIGLIILGTLVYFRNSINIGGAFSFLNSIPLSVIIVAFGASLIAFVIIIAFYFEYGNNSWVYWLGFPAIIYITSLVITVLNQSLTAGVIDVGAAASASTNPLMAGIFALFLGGSAYARAPVISVLPVINTVRVVDDVLSLEQMNPVMKGLGVSYWVWWMLFISMMTAVGKAAINKS
jgi:hypothetical protein